MEFLLCLSKYTQEYNPTATALCGAWIWFSSGANSTAQTTVVARAQVARTVFTPLFGEREAAARNPAAEAAMARAMAEGALGVEQYSESMAGMNERGEFQDEAPSI